MSDLGSLAKLGNKNSMWTGNSIFVSCSNCKKLIWRTKSRILNHNFCSMKCRAEYFKISISKEDLFREYVINNKNLESTGSFFNCGHETIRKLLIRHGIEIRNGGCRLKGEDHSNWQGGKPKCVDCGKELSAYHCMRCVDCAHRGDLNSMHGVHRFGEASPNYIHGLSQESYPHEFQIKKINILKRDNYKCQCCNMTEKEHLIKYNTQLHVHHINYNKFINKDWNLITTCMKCNIKANGDRDYWFAYYTYIMENKT